MTDCTLASLVPRPREEGEKWPGTNCTHMRQHFRNIYRKIVRILLMKHVVMPRKEKTDEIYGRRELQAKKTLLPIVIIVETSKIALTYPFCSKAVVFRFKKATNTVILSRSYQC